jgi:tripartite-type tricarboxylate transporter receptor subunit TctC
MKKARETKTSMRAFAAALVLAAGLTAAFGAALAHAQEAAGAYPSHPVRLVVPFPAGSLPDTLGRSIGDSLQERLGQPFVIDNRAGASTLLGAKLVASAPPDGYTLMVATVTTLTLAPQLLAKPGFDPLREMTPIARLGATNFFLSVGPAFPAHSMKEWIAEVKNHPGKYSYASSGNGSPHHIFMELLKKELGLDIVHVPYKGSSSGMLDLLSGKTDMAFLDGTLAIPNIKAGKLIAIGTSMARRSVLMPGVPPIAETVPGFDWSGWIGFAGPANMPAPVVAKIADEIRRLQATPHYADILNQGAMEPTAPLSPAEMNEFVKSEYRRWGPAIKASGATID